MNQTAQPITARDTIADALSSLTGEQASQTDAEHIIRTLEAAGFVLMAPQDVEWGSCSQSDTGQHRVALNMCTWCLQYDPE